jgi:hypothetical protein
MIANPASAIDTTLRTRYQRHVAALLAEIDERRHHLLFLRAGGAQAMGLRDLKAQLECVRHELAATTAAGSH